MAKQGTGTYQLELKGGGDFSCRVGGTGTGTLNTRPTSHLRSSSLSQPNPKLLRTSTPPFNNVPTARRRPVDDRCPRAAHRTEPHRTIARETKKKS